MPLQILIFHLHLLYRRRLREATIGRSSGSRIILLITPSHPFKTGSGIVTFVPGTAVGPLLISNNTRHGFPFISTHLCAKIPIIYFLNKKSNLFLYHIDGNSTVSSNYLSNEMF